MDKHELDPVATVEWLKDSYSVLGSLMRNFASPRARIRHRRLLKIKDTGSQSKSKTLKKTA